MNFLTRFNKSLHEPVLGKLTNISRIIKHENTSEHLLYRLLTALLYIRNENLISVLTGELPNKIEECNEKAELHLLLLLFQYTSSESRRKKFLCN